MIQNGDNIGTGLGSSDGSLTYDSATYFHNDILIDDLEAICFFRNRL